MWPFWISNALWTRAIVFYCCKRILRSWQSWPRPKKWLCQTWVWGELPCAQKNSTIKPKASQRTTLITKHTGSNPNAIQDHHMKCHQHPPWEITSPTEEVRLHDVASLLHVGCHTLLSGVACYDFQQCMRFSAVPLNLHQDLGHSGWRWKSTSFRIIMTLVPAKLATSSMRHLENKKHVKQSWFARV